MPLDEPRTSHASWPQDLAEWLATAGLFLSVTLVCAKFQPLVSHNEGFGWDGVHYARMTVQMSAGRRPTEWMAYIHRLGPPYLVSLLPIREVSDIRDHFQMLAILANAAVVVLLAFFLRAHVQNAFCRLLAIGLFVTHWLSPVRLAWYAPVHVDYLANVCLVLGLLLAEASARRRSRALALLLTLLALLAMTVHNTFVVVALAYCFTCNPIGRRREHVDAREGAVATRRPIFPPLAALPFMACVAGIIAVRWYALELDPVENRFQLPKAVQIPPLRRLWDYPLVWFIVFGPAMALLLFDVRHVLRFLVEHQHLAVYVLAYAALGLVGSTDAERYLFWAFPVVYLLIALAVERHAPRLRQRPVVATLVAILLLGGQSLTHRVFWSLPDGASTPPWPPLLTPWGSQFPIAHLSTYAGDRAVLILMLVEYTIWAAALLCLLMLRRTRAPTTPG